MTGIRFRQLGLTPQRVRYVQQGAGRAENDGDVLIFQRVQHIQRLFIMIAPDVSAVDKTGKQQLIRREAVLLYQRSGLLALYKIQTNAIEIQCRDVRIAVADIAEIGL